MLTPIAPFFSAKGILRERMKAARREAAKKRPDAAVHAARVFMENIPLAEGAVVALYHPLKDELSTAPLAAALAGKGAVLALPVVERRGAGLLFRRWREDAALAKGLFGAMAPDQSAETADPDIIVAPLLAFTRAGDRLGYGGGYYDRTIAAARARRPVLAVGFGYGAQQVDALPLSPLDQPMDWIVTEQGAIQMRPRTGKGGA